MVALLDTQTAETETECAAAVACTIVAVTMRQSEPVLELLGLPLDAKYLLLCLAALLWGTSRAGGNVVDSSLADSVPTGEAPPAMVTWNSVTLPHTVDHASAHN